MAADCAVWKLEVYGCKTWILIENLKVVQGKGKRPLRSTFGTLDSGTQKIHRSRKTSGLSFNGQPCLLEQVVILTIAIHNAACNGRLSKWQKQQE
jgi:hypothetical protein